MPYATIEFPEGLSAHQVSGVMARAAKELAALNGLEHKRVAESPTLVFRVFRPEPPEAPKVVSMADRRRTARPSLFPAFTPPSAA